MDAANDLNSVKALITILRILFAATAVLLLVPVAILFTEVLAGVTARRAIVSQRRRREDRKSVV